MSSAASLVDWDLAGRTARRLQGPGPETTREEATAVVAELHRAAAQAVAHVETLTGLHPVPGGPQPTVAVVDRPLAQWVYDTDDAEQLLRRYAVMMGALASR